MNSTATRKMVFNGLMIALVFLTTFFTKIPGPVGPFNIGDAAIMVAAIVLGKGCGMLSGALGSALADIAMGYGIFAPITFVVKGLEGYLIGLYAEKMEGRYNPEGVRIIAVIIGAFVMVAGYFIAEVYILRLVDDSFGFAKAMTELPVNVVQGVVSAVAGYAVSTILMREKLRKYIL